MIYTLKIVGICWCVLTLQLSKFYPNDISSVELMRLEFQLDTFIDDMRKDDRFKCVNHLGELSTMLVETKKASCL